MYSHFEWGDLMKNFIIICLILAKLTAQDLASDSVYSFPRDAQSIELSKVRTLELDPYGVYCAQHKTFLRGMGWFRRLDDKNLILNLDWPYFYSLINAACEKNPLLKFTSPGQFSMLIGLLKEKMPLLGEIKLLTTKAASNKLAPVKTLLNENGITLEEYCVIDLSN